MKGFGMRRVFGAAMATAAAMLGDRRHEEISPSLLLKKQEFSVPFQPHYGGHGGYRQRPDNDRSKYDPPHREGSITQAEFDLEVRNAMSMGHRKAAIWVRAMLQTRQHIRVS